MPTYKFTFPQTTILIEGKNMQEVFMFLMPILEKQREYKFDLYNPKNCITESVLKTPLQQMQKKILSEHE